MYIRRNTCVAHGVRGYHKAAIYSPQTRIIAQSDHDRSCVTRDTKPLPSSKIQFSTFLFFFLIDDFLFLPTIIAQNRSLENDQFFLHIVVLDYKYLLFDSRIVEQIVERSIYVFTRKMLKKKITKGTLSQI